MKPICRTRVNSRLPKACALLWFVLVSGLGAGDAVRHAKRFTMDVRPGYTLLTVVNPWRNAKTSFAYALVPRESKLPENLPANATVVRTPVRRIVLTSSTYMAYFDQLGLVDRIVGVSNGSVVNTESVAKRIASGRIHEVGTGRGMTGRVNIEKLFALQPDLVMSYGTGNPRFDVHPKLTEAGFKVAINAEYMETTPLGRTEWIKFIAAFFAADKRAEARFREVEAAYQKIAALAARVEKRPTVFCNIDHNGSWYVPGGQSFVAAFLRDAGADYLWADDRSSGGMPLGVEAVIERARNADFWLNPGICGSRKDIQAMDDRYRLFQALRTGHVYNNNAKVNERGGNDYWETGVANPHLVLQDLIHIFHPSLLPKHQLIWYRKLPEE